MSKFITYREEDKNGNLCYYILQKDFPHFVGIISTSPSEGTWQSAIPNYNLWVVYAGTIRGNFVPSYRNISEETQSVFDEMAHWYYANRICEEPNKYKKFKINVSSST